MVLFTNNRHFNNKTRLVNELGHEIVLYYVMFMI